MRPPTSGVHVTARVLNWLRSTEDLELYFLVAAGLLFSALGLVGIVGQDVLGPAVLALLAVLAFSQLRTRRGLTAIYRTQQLRRTSLFTSQFPENLHARRAAAHDYLYLGRSMARTAVTSVGEFGSAIARGAKIRVVVADPTDEHLMRTIARGPPKTAAGTTTSAPRPNGSGVTRRLSTSPSIRPGRQANPTRASGGSATSQVPGSPRDPDRWDPRNLSAARPSMTAPSSPNCRFGQRPLAERDATQSDLRTGSRLRIIGPRSAPFQVVGRPPRV